MNCELSLRLQTCLDALHPLQSIADIGTDHAYLPCAGLLRGQLKRAIAADVGGGPLEAAKATISKYNLDDLIETRLGSGLSVIKPGEVEGVVIAGMGGKLITSILEADIPLAKSFNRLILQPNLDANVLRTFLMKNQFLSFFCLRKNKHLKMPLKKIGALTQIIFTALPPSQFSTNNRAVPLPKQ